MSETFDVVYADPPWRYENRDALARVIRGVSRDEGLSPMCWVDPYIAAEAVLAHLPAQPATGSRRVEQALRAANRGEAFHWPTIATTLAREVERLRAALATASAVADLPPTP